MTRAGKLNSNAPALSLAERLLLTLVNQISVFLEIQVDFLADLGVQWSGRAAKKVEVQLEPVIGFLMKDSVLVAERARGDVLLDRLGLGRRTVFVGTTDVECAPIASACMR